MAESAENLAREGKIDREVQEEFAISSHQKALEAWKNGRFNNEVIPVQHNNLIIAHDEGPREPQEKQMAALPPLFPPDGSVTAATTSPLSLGAAALLMTSASLAKELGLKPRARVLSRAAAGVEWERMGRSRGRLGQRIRPKGIVISRTSGFNAVFSPVFMIRMCYLSPKAGGTTVFSSPAAHSTLLYPSKEPVVAAS